MELLQLKYFVSAARDESFSRTAERFGVPASNISQSIKRLERELGCELFERRANRVSLSEEGRTFLSGVESALSQLERSVCEVKDDPKRGEIKILAAAIRRIVMQTVERFKRQYPEVEIFLSYDESESPESFDIAVSDGDFKHFGEGEHLMSEEMVLALNRSHPIAKKESVTPSDLKNEAFISMGTESSLSRMGERICKSAGFEPVVSIRSDDPFYVRRCVELSLGVAIVPSISWRGLFDGEVVLRSLFGARRDTFVYLNRKKYIKSSAATFVRMLREECAKEQSRKP